MIRTAIKLLLGVFKLLALGLWRLCFMAWTTPTTRATGDLITAAIWNTDVVNNLQFVHDRYGVIYAPAIGTAAHHVDGEWLTPRIAFVTPYMNFAVPDDFSAIVSAEILVWPLGTTTDLVYQADSAYGNPDAVEASDNHTGTLTSGATSMTIDKMYLLNVASVFGSLAAGDFATLNLAVTAGTGYSFLNVAGFRLVYSRL